MAPGKSRVWMEHHPRRGESRQASYQSNLAALQLLMGVYSVMMSEAVHLNASRSLLITR